MKQIFPSSITAFATLVSVSAPLILTSCPGTDTSKMDPLVTSASTTTGTLVGAAEARKLDRFLAEPMRMKREVEEVAGKLKREHANDSAVITKSRSLYLTSTSSLDRLRESIKRDLTVGEGTSEATRTALKDYERTGNDLRFYYSEVSGGNRFGASIMIGLGLVTQLVNAYSGYTEAKNSAIEAGLDARLSPAEWESL